jgi:UDP-glucose pyrophosphorylase
VVVEKFSLSSFPRRRIWHTVSSYDKSNAEELLPIVDKPLIQYAAEEAISAGIDTLIFVTGRNNRAIEDHFYNNTELEMALRSAGKDEQADMVKNILPDGVECIFVRQSEQLGLGHAWLCAERGCRR